ncbi:DUF6404 family protein [Roseobacter sp. HKCCA0434]|uniref:DUF6404 family protein n=1 Tax=Roseobacter sp. HKCCA0434 TaxID=3079297 RepID=UPI002905EAA9|nr:DUF6404 family protein [Roseobacter sp. HKCCA0434]
MTRPRPLHATTSAPATNRRERLARALRVLERGGITGSHAYAPALRGLASLGLIVKPFHFWSFPALAIVGILLMSALFGLAIWASLAIGIVPRPIATVIEAGPIVFVAVMTIGGLFFAIAHRRKARQIGLPKWSDL